MTALGTVLLLAHTYKRNTPAGKIIFGFFCLLDHATNSTRLGSILLRLGSRLKAQGSISLHIVSWRQAKENEHLMVDLDDDTNGVVNVTNPCDRTRF